MIKVLFITTGGTIASDITNNGLKPKYNGKDLLKSVHGLNDKFQIEILELMNLDSSNVQVEEQKIMAKAIYDNIDRFDGIVLTHGTDTMSYTASILSFMLVNLNKPVIITGSQLSISDPLTDARNNIYTAFLAVKHNICGVNIAFDRKIIRGCRSSKVRTLGFNAFSSINILPIAKVYSDGIHIIDSLLLKKNKKPLVLNLDVSNDVFLLKLIPGTNPKIFSQVRDLGYKGIVVEAFGVGGLHYFRRNLIKELEKITLDFPIVVCSQCLYEKSDLSVYEVGKLLLEAGVIEARDMTTEAAVTKLMVTLGKYDTVEEIKKSFNTNFCGEISLD